LSDTPAPEILRNNRFPLPRALEARTRFAWLGPSRVPALLAHPDWQSKAPVCIWMHGRTVNKELDSGRYLRFIRAGIAAVALDLPGHGERLIAEYQTGKRTPEMIAQMVAELSEVLAALALPEYAPYFDLSRVAIGGMSAGGMCTLRALCEPDHTFVCAAVEGTTGDLDTLYRGTPGGPWPAQHEQAAVERVDPSKHLQTFRPIPVLALHSQADAVVPFAGQAGFIKSLREHYAAVGANPELVQLVSWPETGAPQEHNGFGRVASEAKTAQVEFLTKWLRAVTPTDSF